MKRDDKRPRGRRTLPRGCALALLALVAPGVASDAAQGAGLLNPRISTIISPGVPHDPVVAGPDGKIWSLEARYEGAGLRRLVIARYDATTRLTAVASPGTDPLSPLTPLASGGMGAVVGLTGTSRSSYGSVSFVRTDARGTAVGSTRLPSVARVADAFAVAGDGSVWFIDTCASQLLRWQRGKRLEKVSLPRTRCDGTGPAPSLAVGPDGSVWFVSSRQARVIRRDVRGKLRQWRFPRGRETYSSPTLVVDPRGGGAAFTDTTPDGTASGWITGRGNLLSWNRSNQPVFGPDGKLWFAGSGGLTSFSASGETTSLTLPDSLAATTAVIARDGTPWYLAGTFEAPPSIEPYVVGLSIGTIVRDAPVVWSLPANSGYPPTQPAEPTVGMVLGGDGALWTRVEDSWNQTRLVRLTPIGLTAPRRPTARATRLLARSGRVVTMQVACAADRGRFCRGTVRLRGASSTVGYIAPGQSGTAVRVTLGRAAARTLRRGRAVRTNAVISSVGAGTTQQRLIVR